MIGSIISAAVAPLNGTRRVSTFLPPQFRTPFFKELPTALRRPFVWLAAAGWMSISAATPGISAHGQDPTSVSQQAPAPIPEFEVATIKPNKASDGMRLMAHTPTGLSVKNLPVLFLIRDAFGLEDDRILGAPAWVNTDRFDIEAKVGESDIPRLKTMTVDQRRLMLRPLLQERFNLKFHYESKVLPVYALVIGKSGSRMKQFEPPGNPATNGLRYSGRGHLEARGTEAPQWSLSCQCYRNKLVERSWTKRGLKEATLSRWNGSPTTSRRWQGAKMAFLPIPARLPYRYRIRPRQRQPGDHRPGTQQRCLVREPS